MRVILAEKPSVAKDIAKCLNITGRRDGYIEGRDTIVTWTYGHLVELQEPNEYHPKWKRWSVETLPILPTKFKLKPKGDKSALKQLKIIRELFKKASEIICATDAGREGELIFRYIKEWAGLSKKPFKRLWISSLTNESIKQGFANLKDGCEFDSLYQAAKCRSEADWLVGLNATRFFTVKFGNYTNLWTIGRVQTPVLAMIVQRDLSIIKFVARPYWEINTLYRNVNFNYKGGKFFKAEEAQELLNSIQNHNLTITNIKEKKEKLPPPRLFDLTDLQKDMNRIYGMTADQTLKTAQSLYERKHITYPRTDSRHLTDDLKPKMANLLKNLQKIKAEEISAVNLKQLTLNKRVFNSSKVSDHHAIIPTEVIASNLPPDQFKVYDAIVKRFIASFYPDCIKSVTTVDAKAEKVPFKASGTVTLDAGWMKIYSSAQKTKRPTEKLQTMPLFKSGEQGAHTPKLKEMATKPPRHFTDASLLHLMETAGKEIEDEQLKEALKNRGLGTPATRASIIETLLQRKYIARDKKQLISTISGRHLIDLIPNHRLKSPELTGEWESDLKKMERDQFKATTFMQNIVDYINEILTHQDVPGEQHKLGKCPLCFSPIVEGKKGFGCSRWTEGCKFVLWKELFGITITPSMAQEILSLRASRNLLDLTVNGEAIKAKIIIDNSGECNFEKNSSKKRSPQLSIGKCPLCCGSVVETPKAYGCGQWREGCRFTIWKKIAKKNITLSMAKKLLTKGETPLMKGFTSKAGKSFDAKLKLDAGKVQFQFEN